MEEPTRDRQRVVSFNGADNTGKTSGAILLTSMFDDSPRLGGLSRYVSFPGGDPVDPSWWFESSVPGELAQALLEGYVGRLAFARSTDAATVVLDRGFLSIRSAFVATMLTRDLKVAGEASAREEEAGRWREYFDSLAERSGINRHDEDVSLLLRNGSTIASSVALGLSREARVDDRYRAYQRHLVTELENVAHEFSLHASPDSSVVDAVMVAARALALNTQPLDRLQQCVLIGGLSESGKSSIGQYLAEHGYQRLKMGYLTETGALLGGEREAHVGDDEEIAMRLLRGLLHFLRSHRDVRCVALESVHRPGVAQRVKNALAGRAHLVYVDAPEEVRRIRSEDSQELLTEKDAEKRLRGADTFREIADLVIDNGSSRRYAQLQLRRGLARSMDRVRVEDGGPYGHTITSSVNLELDGQVSLLALVGSRGEGTATMHSDFDILLVTADDVSNKVRHVYETLRRELPQHVGLTHVTEDEVYEDAVDSRTARYLAQIRRGDLQVLVLRPGFRIPELSETLGLHDTRRFLGRTLHEFRRAMFLRRPADLRTEKKQRDIAKMTARLDSGVYLDDARGLGNMTSFPLIEKESSV